MERVAAILRRLLSLVGVAGTMEPNRANKPHTGDKKKVSAPKQSEPSGSGGQPSSSTITLEDVRVPRKPATFGSMFQILSAGK